MPETGLSPVYVSAWILIALGGILLIWLVGRAVLVIWQRFQPLNVWTRYAEESSPYRRRRRRGWGWLGALLLLLFGLALIGVGVSLLFVEQAGRGYQALSEDVVARLQCLPAGTEAEPAMTCNLTLAGREPYTVTLPGERWEMEGEVLVWDSAAEQFGLRSGYRLIRLVGYDSADRAVAKIDLPGAENAPNPFCSWLFDWLPLVNTQRQIVSGEAAVGVYYELSVSRAGFRPIRWESVQP